LETVAWNEMTTTNSFIQCEHPFEQQCEVMETIVRDPLWEKCPSSFSFCH